MSRRLLLLGSNARELAHDLRGRQFDVVLAADPAAAEGAFDCAVVVDERLAARLAEHHPALPWVSAGGALDALVARIMAAIPGARGASPIEELRSSRREKPLAGVSVLVVDDDLEMRQALRRVLTRAGASVVGAADAGEALDKLRAVEIDAVVTDYALGGERHGLALLAALRELRPSIARVLLSGHDFGGVDAPPGDRSAAERILTKPWSGDALVEACRALRRTAR